MTRYDEERLGALLGLLPPAPEAWVRAAQELPAARTALANIVERAGADAKFRASVLADLENVLVHEGIEPEPHLVRELRRCLAAPEP